MHTESEIVVFLFFLYLSSFPIKTLATDAKTQKIEFELIFFYDGQTFRRQCVNKIDIT